jgi:hypothetical protein
MNQASLPIRRETQSKANVGLAWVEVSFASSLITKRGWLHQVAVDLTAGGATQAALRVRESSGGRILMSYETLENLDLVYADGRIWFDSATLLVEVQTDDAGGTTGLDIELTIEEL